MIPNIKLPCITTIVFILQQVQCFDPCTTTKEINDLDKRFDVYISDVSGGEDLLCDRLNIATSGEWFMVPLDQPMRTNASMPFMCGTHYPIWMDGTVPSETAGTVLRDVCIPGTSACDVRMGIQVRHCGNKGIAYHLVPTPSCPQAYCFGYGEDGAAPTEVITKPTVDFELINVTNWGIKQQIVFKCNFVVPNNALFYQVHWFADNKTLYTSSAYGIQEIEKTYLKHGPKMLNSLGITISCSVRARMKPKSQPGTMSAISDGFFAGIKVLTPLVNLEDGKTEDIIIQPTVPFECSYLSDGKLHDCKLSVEIQIPKSSTCTGSIGQVEDITDSYRQCGKDIVRNNWNKNTSLSITWQNDLTYIEEGLHYVSLKVLEKKHHPLWNFYLPPVKVFLKKSKNEIQNNTCYAHNDPHMMTFDGHKYENHVDGKFILYRHTNTKHHMEVQIQFRQCQNNYPMCTCGLAVRAGGDVFVINRCPNNKNEFQYRSCSDDILEVTKEDEYNYKIYFPSGTLVHAIIDNHRDYGKVMNVLVYPTNKDMNKTEGLCGKLNGKDNDDFTKRDGSTFTLKDYKTDTTYEFPKEWRSNPDEDLFGMTDDKIKSLAEWTKDVRYCTCDTNTTSTDIIDTLNCSPASTVKCKRTEKKVISPARCLAKIRQVRAARPKFTFIPNNFLPSETNRRVKRSTVVNMTSSEARRYCAEFMNASDTIRACGDVPNVKISEAIDLCALDIELTGTLDWAKGTRETVRASCMKELNANRTLQRENNGAPSIMETIMKIACPNECSGNGKCENGTCLCNDGFGSSDCSLDLNAPPEVNGVNIDEGGICDVVHCDKAYVTGDDFIDTTNLKCRMQKFSIDPYGKRTEVETFYAQGHHESLFEVQCPIWPSRRKRRSSSDKAFVIEFKISVSNTGKVYSPGHSLFVLDAECQDVVNVSGEVQFVLRDGYCFINGKCIGNGMTAINDKCNICDVTKSRYEYSYLANTEDCKQGQKHEDGNRLWIIGAVLGAVSFIAAVVVIILIIKMKLKRKQRIGGSVPNFSQQLEKPPAYQ